MKFMKIQKKFIVMAMVMVFCLVGSVQAETAQSAYKALKKFDTIAQAGVTKNKLFEVWGETKAEVEGYLDSKSARKSQFAEDAADVLKEFEKTVKLMSDGYAYKAACQWEDVAHKKFMDMRKP